MEMMEVMVMSLLLLVSRVETMSRPRPEQCYYQPYYKQLTCSCTKEIKESSDTYLGLNMIYYVRTLGQEVRSVVVRSCEQLTLGLDFKGVNPTDIPITIQQCGQVRMDFIIFDPAWSDEQSLNLNFKHVENVTFSQLHLDHVTFISALDVKYVGISETTFVNTTQASIRINHCQELRVTNTIFLNLEPETFQISRTKHVVMVDNQMPLNAISAISAQESSNLFISCNREPGAPVSPECKHPVRTFRSFTTTTTTTTTIVTTTTTTRSLTITTISPRLLAAQLNSSSKTEKIQPAESQSLLGVLLCVCVSLIFLLLILLYIYRTNRTCRTLQLKLPSPVSRRPDTPLPPLPPPPPSPSPLPSPAVTVRSQTSSQPQPQPSNPAAWILEIEKNKLFNKVRHQIDESDETETTSQKPTG